MAAINPNAKALKSATTNVDVSAATAPSSGQVLTATGTTAATWQTPSGGADKIVWVKPGEGRLSTASVTSLTTAIPVVAFNDASTCFWDMAVKVPTGCTSISSIKVWYCREVSAVVRLTFATAHIDTDAAGTVYEQDLTDTETSYTVTSADANFESATVPTGAYNGLTNIDADDIITLRITRTGGSASDTYNATWNVLGVLFTFA